MIYDRLIYQFFFFNKVIHMNKILLEIEYDFKSMNDLYITYYTDVTIIYI